MPARIYRWILIACFAAMLLLPHAQALFRIWDDSDLTLIGIRTDNDPFPSVTLRSWWDGSYAANVDQWTRGHIALRPFWVRLQRTACLKWTGQVYHSAPNKSDVVVGVPPFLFENIYILDAIVPSTDFEPRMGKYKELLVSGCNYLRSRNKALVIILAPNKALLHPEALPRNVRKKADDANTDYPRFLRLLRENDIPHLDAMQFFRDEAHAPDVTYFDAPLGAHWSYYGAWRTWQAAIPIINGQQLLPPIPLPETADLQLGPPMSMDQELLPQLNILPPRTDTDLPAAYPIAAPLDTPPPPLSALVVGDSYGFGLSDAMMRAPLFKHLYYWYYCRTLYDIPSPTFDPAQTQFYTRFRSFMADGSKRAQLGNRYIVDNSDVILVVMTTFNIDKQAWRFFQLLDAMAQEDAAAPLHAD